MNLQNSSECGGRHPRRRHSLAVGSRADVVLEVVAEIQRLHFGFVLVLAVFPVADATDEVATNIVFLVVLALVFRRIGHFVWNEKINTLSARTPEKRTSLFSEIDLLWVHPAQKEIQQESYCTQSECATK
jgi:hypothetical protein